MKKFILTLICFTTLNSIISQTIYKPFINRQDENNFTIDKIENTNNNTIVNFTFKSSDDYVNGGTVMINPNIIIKETSGDREYKLIKSEGMPLSPNKHSFSFNGEKLRFKLYFPKIDNTIKSIDIIESINNKLFFNFYGISLESDKIKNEKTNEFSDQFITYIPTEIKNIFKTGAFVESQNNSLSKYFNSLIEKLGKEKSKDITEIEIGENETSQTYTFVLNNKANPIIEFFFRNDSKLNGGIDFMRFGFTNEKEAFLFFSGFADYYGYSINDKTGLKIFSTPSNLYYSLIRLIKYSENYFLVEIIVSDKSPF